MNKTRRIELALFALAVIVATIAVAQSWNRWLDPLIDVGRDLYVSEQLHDGVRLYRDIRYYYAPLGPYLLSALTLVTGNSLAAFATIGLLSGVCVGFMLWFFLRSYGGLAMALLFAGCYLCGASTYRANYLFPYSYAATFGMLFFLTFGALLYRHLFFGSRWALPAALVFGLAAGWSRIELAAAVGAIILFVAIIHRVHAAWLWIVGMAILLGGALAYFGRAAFVENVFPIKLFTGRSALFFYGQVTGLDEWPRKLALSFLGAAAIGCAVWLIALLERRRERLEITVLLGISLAAIMLYLSMGPFFYAWSILQLALLPFALRRPREPLAFVLLLSLVGSARVFLSLSPDWYGFVYTVPVLVLIGYTLFEWLPSRGVYSRTSALLWVPLLIVIAGSCLYYQNRRFAQKTARIVTARGVLYDEDPDRARAINEMLPKLRGAKSLVVFPEGVSINYFAGVKNPLSFYSFIPPETADPRIESVVLGELQRTPPEYAAIVTRDVSEFGFRAFGFDYDRRTGDYLRANYGLVGSWRSPSFQMLLLKRLPQARHE